MSDFILPSKIISLLRRLKIDYEREGEGLFAEILNDAQVYVREGEIYDNWNGGTHGHDIVLFLSEDTFKKVNSQTLDSFCNSVIFALNGRTESILNEHFNRVHLELADENDVEYQKALRTSAKLPIAPETVSFWKSGQIRLFISHRDSHKADVKLLADALEGYGVSSFIAHETIEPSKEWQKEIEKGLETMEVMLAYITDNFNDSCWTNQEIGYALGKNIPIISIKAETKDPVGFVGHIQALKFRQDEYASSVVNIYRLVTEKLGNADRLQRAFVSAFVKSPGFMETKLRFDRLDSVVKKLTNEELSEIIRGFFENDQLHKAGHLTSKYQRLKNFLERTTGKEFTIEGKTISEKKITFDDEIPF